MNTAPIDPKALSEGRTLVTLTPQNVSPGSTVVVGPAFFPGRAAFPVVRTAKPPQVGYHAGWPDAAPWKDGVAYWDGAKWLGKQAEIECLFKNGAYVPGFMQYLGTKPVGTRDSLKEVWPDPCVVADGLGASGNPIFAQVGGTWEQTTARLRTQVHLSLYNCPAEALEVKDTEGEGCDYHLNCTGNSVRVHGNRPLVIQRGPGRNRFFFYGCESLGQLIRCENMGEGPYPSVYGLAKCLALLSDAGGIYIAGRGLDVQGGLADSDVKIERLPRLAPIVGWGTCGIYGDDCASGLAPGKIATAGFEFSGVNGGGSNSDFSGVTGGPFWNEDRSRFTALKDYKGVCARPYKVVTPSEVLPS